MATGYGLDGRGSIPTGVDIFSTPECQPRFWGPSNLLSNGYRGIFPRGVKRSGHYTDQSLLSIAEIKYGGAIPPLPIRLHGMFFFGATAPIWALGLPP
jgi:hypothetical protein